MFNLRKNDGGGDYLSCIKLSRSLQPAAVTNEGIHYRLLPSSSPVHHDIMNADQMNGIMKARTLLLGWAEMTLEDLAKARVLHLNSKDWRMNDLISELIN